MSADVGPDAFDLGAGQSNGGSNHSGDESSAGGSPDVDSGGAVDPTAITDTLGSCRGDRCRGDGADAVTLTDLASFTPTAPSLHLEPDGWALRGRPVNAVADSVVNTHDGSLLGHPVTVRFTPSAYHWDWGDGSRDSTTTPGRSWDDLGLPRFSDTPTSHTYAERGSVTVTLTVDFTVGYRVADPIDGANTDDTAWTSVTGTVSSRTTATVRVVTGTTVNVPDDCTDSPTAPGC